MKPAPPQGNEILVVLFMLLMLLILATFILSLLLFSQSRRHAKEIKKMQNMCKKVPELIVMSESGQCYHASAQCPSLTAHRRTSVVEKRPCKRCWAIE